MVSIGDFGNFDNFNLGKRFAQMSMRQSGINTPVAKPANKSNNLQARFEAIDRGEYSPVYGHNKASGGTLLERLNAIGDGELHPKKGVMFDTYA